MIYSCHPRHEEYDFYCVRDLVDCGAFFRLPKLNAEVPVRTECVWFSESGMSVKRSAVTVGDGSE